MVSYFLNRKAFSLVECGIVLTLTAVLLVVLYPSAHQLIKNARQEKEEKSLKSLAVACRQYYASYGRWPVHITELYPYFIALPLPADEYFLYTHTGFMKIHHLGFSVTVIKPQ